MEEMYYYQQNGKFFEKYLISFDANELKDLRDEMREKCSRIIPNQIGEFIANPKDAHLNDKKFIAVIDLGVSKTVERETDSDIVYHKYRYTLYLYPEEVILIDELIKGNAQAYGSIIFHEKPNYEKLINDAYMAVDKIDNMNFAAKISAVYDLQALDEEAACSQNQRGTIEYQDRFNEIINLKLIERIKVSDIKKILRFFNQDVNAIGLEYSTNKVLVYKPSK